MIRALFDAATVTAAASAPESRTIGGVAVPWNVPGRVQSGELVVFHPGSLDATSRPVLLRDHDRARPIGRVIDAADNGAGMAVNTRVAATRDGDEALLLAAPPDQVLGMFSVGADPTNYRYGADGTLHVYAADWHELSLLTIGAYADARVSTVTAQGGPMLTTATPDPIVTPDPNAPPVQPDPNAPPPAPAPAPDPNAPNPDEPVNRGQLVYASAPAPRPVPLAVNAGAQPPRLNLPGVAAILSEGIRTRVGAAAMNSRIQAAWTNVTTTDIAGIVQPAYRSEIVGLIDHGMPLVSVLDQRPLPASGMAIEYPYWTDPPDSYAVQAAEKTEIASGLVRVGIKSDNIQTWAQGNDVSFQALNRSDPSFIDAYLRAAAVDAGRKYDTYVGATLLAAATAATLPTTVTFVNAVAALFAALNPATTPPGPLFLAVSYDVALSLIPVTGLGGPAYWDASIDFGSIMPTATAGGLTIFADWNLPAKTMLLGSRMGAANYGGPATSADVRVVDVSLLGVDIGVYFYAALAIEYPGAFAKLTGVTIPLAEGAEPAGKGK